MPEGVEIGERVMFEGFEGAPEPVLNPKKKLWEKIAPDLTTNAGAHGSTPFTGVGGFHVDCCLSHICFACCSWHEC